MYREIIAPCGHAGEYVIGTYIACRQKCNEANKKPILTKLYVGLLDESYKELVGSNYSRQPAMLMPDGTLTVTWGEGTLPSSVRIAHFSIEMSLPMFDIKSFTWVGDIRPSVRAVWGDLILSNITLNIDGQPIDIVKLLETI